MKTLIKNFRMPLHADNYFLNNMTNQQKQNILRNREIMIFDAIIVYHTMESP